MDCESLQRACIRLLNQELMVALGCTEPIAVALCAARTRDLLGTVPDHLELFCSGNIIKNVKSVVIPNSGGQRGIAVAAVMGALQGHAERSLEILENFPENKIPLLNQFIAQSKVKVKPAENVENLYVKVNSYVAENKVTCIISKEHDRFIYLAKNDEVLFEIEERQSANPDSCLLDLKIADLVELAKAIALDIPENLEDKINKMLSYNFAIAEEGLNNHYGAEVGRSILNKRSRDLHNEIIAHVAAGSDARMNGCNLPVVIVSGSGNQGITASVPVLIYARTKKIADSKLKEAILLSCLLTLYQKQYIGRLSAFCGVVSASAAAVAAIGYLQGCSAKQIGDIIANTLAIAGGIVCDGAKSSCAAKIALGLNCAFMARDLVENGTSFQAGEGIVEAMPEKTIQNVGFIGREGMRETDKMIMKIMLDDLAEE